ncbi:hypothetical protein [uncultured Thomasclavelia sp.]|uniref:hypothetical protein n=1 Tax=uncultured Thomasclavelia sp. TaxID=3025759 RepID=UPI0026022391|nr:hypothetical protein [uncultured Thomasclavelia sp.]
MADFETMEKLLKEMGFNYQYEFNDYWNTDYLSIDIGNYKIPLILKYDAGNTTSVVKVLSKNKIINVIRKKIIDVEISKINENRIYHQDEIVDLDKEGMYALSDRELDQLDSFNKTGSVSKADLKIAKQRRNELFESLNYLNETNVDYLRYKLTDDNQRKANDKYDKNNMSVVSGKFKKEFVNEFKEACSVLNIKQSDVFRKAMQETIDKAKK